LRTERETAPTSAIWSGLRVRRCHGRFASSINQAGANSPYLRTGPSGEQHRREHSDYRIFPDGPQLLGFLICDLTRVADRKELCRSGRSFLAKLSGFSMLARASFRLPTMKQPCTMMLASWRPRTSLCATSRRGGHHYFFHAVDHFNLPALKADAEQAGTSFVQRRKQFGFGTDICAAVGIMNRPCSNRMANRHRPSRSQFSAICERAPRPRPAHRCPCHRFRYRASLRRLRCSGLGYDAVALIGLKHRTCSLSGSIDSQSEGSLSKTGNPQITVEDNRPPPTERRHRRMRLPSSGPQPDSRYKRCTSLGPSHQLQQAETPEAAQSRLTGNERWLSDQLKMRKWHDEFARCRQVFVFPRLEFFDEVPR
jgi:hypothetical protein